MIQDFRKAIKRPIPGEHWHLVSNDGYKTTMGWYIDSIQYAWAFGRFGEVIPLDVPGWRWEPSHE